MAFPFLCFSLGGKSTFPLLFAFSGSVLIIKLTVPSVSFFVFIYRHNMFSFVGMGNLTRRGGFF